MLAYVHAIQNNWNKHASDYKGGNNRTSVSWWRGESTSWEGRGGGGGDHNPDGRSQTPPPVSAEYDLAAMLDKEERKDSIYSHATWKRKKQVQTQKKNKKLRNSFQSVVSRIFWRMWIIFTGYKNKTKKRVTFSEQTHLLAVSRSESTRTLHSFKSLLQLGFFFRFFLWSINTEMETLVRIQHAAVKSCKDLTQKHFKAFQKDYRVKK